MNNQNGINGINEIPAGFGKTGIDWLMSNTSFVGLGVDTLSIELGRVQGCYVHRTLTAGNKVRDGGTAD